METVERDYSPKGVKFYYVYKALAHPETNGYVQPFTQEERLMHVREAERTLGSRIPWICDTMDNAVKHNMGNAPNSEFIVGPDGKVVVRRTWSKPDLVRADLERLVGKVENPTRVADLETKFVAPKPGAARGVVPRINVPSGLMPLRAEPKAGDDGEPFYVKLRAEADREAMGRGAGKLYLGFHIDPLYHVHWNNLAAPLTYSIVAEDGVEISPSQGEGPKVKEAADMDPREFLLDIKNLKPGKPFRVKVNYFACSDEEGWCKPVSQEYLVYLQRDSDGGSARRGNRAGGSGRRPGGPGGFGPGGFGPGGFRPGGFRPGGFRPGGRPGGPPQQPARPGGLGGNRLMGRVVSYNAESKQLTVRDRAGGRTTYRITDKTTIRRGRQAAGSTKDLKQGTIIMLMVRPKRDGDEGSPVIERLMVR